MDERAAALPGDKPGFLFVQRRQSSSAVHPVQSDVIDKAEKENLTTNLQIDAFRVLAQASAKDAARPAPAAGLRGGDRGDRGASVDERGAPQRAGAATTPLEPVTMPSMNPSSAPFLTLGGIRLRRKPRPVRVSSLNRGQGHAEFKASTAVEAARSQLMQQERLERQQRAGRAKAGRKKGGGGLLPSSSSGISTHSISLELQSDMVDCVVSDRQRKGTHQA